MFEEMPIEEVEDNVEDWVTKLKIAWEKSDFTDIQNSVTSLFKKTFSNSLHTHTHTHTHKQVMFYSDPHTIHEWSAIYFSSLVELSYHVEYDLFFVGLHRLFFSSETTSCHSVNVLFKSLSLGSSRIYPPGPLVFVLC